MWWRGLPSLQRPQGAPPHQFLLSIHHLLEPGGDGALDIGPQK
jgi:hypothetical protein